MEDQDKYTGHRPIPIADMPGPGDPPNVGSGAYRPRANSIDVSFGRPVDAEKIMARALGAYVIPRHNDAAVNKLLSALKEAGFVVVPSEVLRQEVLLSNFDGRRSVSVSEFVGYGVMCVKEDAWRKSIAAQEEDNENWL